MIPQGSHRSRWITALVALPLLALCLAQGGWPLFFLVLAVSLAGVWEFHGLFGQDGLCARLAGLSLGALTVWLGWKVGAGEALAVVLAAFWLEETARLWHRPEGAPRWLVAASVAYVPASLQFVCAFGPGETLLVLATVMATDTGAYYAGHLIGGPKIWPRVSPKKTWAGSLGGLAAAVAVCMVAAAFWGKAPLAAFMVLGVCLSVASQMGDFVESAWKRAAGIKDSGALLPGHGGILDRIDGLIPAVLVYALARTAIQYL